MNTKLKELAHERMERAAKRKRQSVNEKPTDSSNATEPLIKKNKTDQQNSSKSSSSSSNTINLLSDSDDDVEKISSNQSSSSSSSSSSSILSTNKQPYNQHTIQVVRNVQGLNGFHIAYNVFNEDTEKRIFNTTYATMSNPAHPLFPREITSDKKSHRGGYHTCADQAPFMPDDYYRCLNAIRDSGLDPSLMQTQQAFSQTYEHDGSFAAHTDSVLHWGSSIVGVSIGRPCIIRLSHMTPGQEGVSNRFKTRDQNIDILLPRRSIYIMQDDARFDWKHAILKNTKSRMKEYSTLNDAPPSWNPKNQRRSVTMRTTRIFDDIQLMNISNPNSVMRARIDRQLHTKIDSGSSRGGKKRTATSQKAKNKWYDEERINILDRENKARRIGINLEEKRGLKFHISDVR